MNPFGGTNAIPIVQTIQQMMQRQANINATQVGTQLEEKKLDLINQSLEADKQFRDAQLKGMLQDPSKNNPETTSVADDDTSTKIPEVGFVKALQSERNNLQKTIETANNNPYSPLAQSTLKQARERMDHIDTNIREAMKDVTKQQQDNLGRVANVLSDINSPEDAVAARDWLARNMGRNAAIAFDRQMPHDPNTGAMLWNDAGKRVVKQYVDGALNAKDKQELADKDRKFQADAKEEQRKVEKDKEDARYHDSEIAVRRAGIAAANKRAELVTQRMGGNMDYKLFKDTQTEINKNADTYKIRDYQKGLEVADRAESALTDPARGYADVTAPAARTLADQFKLMIDNYRSRTGGKYQEQELGKMNGILQRLDKYTDTIGEGDKILAKDVMLQTTQEMKKLALDRNADVVKTELKYSKSLRDRGTNPLPLTTYGDIEALKKNNVAKQVTVNGKDYLVFGRDKSDQYELPSEPDKPRFLPYENPSE